MKSINKNNDYPKAESSWVLIIVMILTGIFGLIGTDIYAPSLPIIPRLFHTSVTLSQLTISIYLVGFAFTQLLAGMLSDYFGRKPILTTGLVIFLVGTVICILASSIFSLLAGRLAQGIGAGAVSVLSRIILRDCFAGVKMAQIGSYLAACIGLSPAIAPVLGGFIQQRFGFAAIFVFLLLYAILVFYLAIYHLSETNRYRHLHHFSFQEMTEKYQRVLASKVFWANAIATGCALSTIVACAVVNPFLLQNILHMSPAQYGMWAFVAMSGMFIGMIINGYWVMKLGIRFMMLLGMLLVLLGGLSFIMFSFVGVLSVDKVIAPTFIITLATAFILPNAIVGAFTPFADIAGTVGAVYGCLQIVITALTSVIISFISAHSQLDIGILLSLLMLSCSFFYFVWGKEDTTFSGAA